MAHITREERAALIQKSLAVLREHVSSAVLIINVPDPDDGGLDDLTTMTYIGGLIPAMGSVAFAARALNKEADKECGSEDE